MVRLDIHVGRNIYETKLLGENRHIGDPEDGHY